MRAAVDTAATRRQQRHPQVKVARLPCGHAILLERPKGPAELITEDGAAGPTCDR
jgi:hypothetical protein